MRLRHLVLAVLAALVATSLVASAARAGIELDAAPPLAIDGARIGMVAGGDLNGDGLDDVVAVDGNVPRVTVLLADVDQPGRLIPHAALSLQAPRNRAAIADLDGDGHADVVVAGRRYGVSVLLGNGDGTLRAPSTVAGFADALDLAVGQAGGAPVLLVADFDAAQVLALTGDGGTPPALQVASRIDAGGRPSRVLAADIDRDGQTDAVTVTAGPRGDVVAVHRLRGVAGGLVELEPPSRATFIDGNVAELLAADVTGDGAVDLIVLDGRGDGAVQLLVNAGDCFTVTVLAVPCPFFTGGLACPLRALATGDVNRDNRADLLIALTDPRRRDGIRPPDALQVWAGRGGAAFTPGPVVAIGEAATALRVGRQNGDCLPDVVVGAGPGARLQVLENRSAPGSRPNGDACLLDAECLSGTCAQARCCATPCADGQRCDVPGYEGICRPAPLDAVPCETAAHCDGVPGQPHCVDAVCCDDSCIGGRCDLPGFEGLCIPGLIDGAPCVQGRACAAGFCSDNGRCCREKCDGGFCDEQGLCHPLKPLGEICGEDLECGSAVCDAFEGVCCSRRCVGACRDGQCVLRAGTTAIICAGDCDGDGTVAVSEVVRLVALALGQAAADCGSPPAVAVCVAIDDVVRAVGNALAGCATE